MTGRTWMWMVVLGVVLSATCVCAQEEVTVTGRVVGPDGEGVAEAEVWWHYRGPEGRAWMSVKTDADGGFEFVYTSMIPRKYCRALVAVEGYALVFVNPGEGPLEIKLSREMASISGTVVDPDGEPLPGVDVRVESLKEPGGEVRGDRGAFLGDWDDTPGATTDKQGQFEIAALPRDVAVRLQAERVGFANYRASWSEEPPVTGDEVEIVMSPEAVISGRVTRDGEPVADVAVRTQSTIDASIGGGSNWGDATTGADGRYEIHGLPASTYNVALFEPDGHTAVAHEAVQVAAGESADDIDFELIEGVMLRGVVTWADTGEPVIEASIAAYGPAHPKSSGWVQATKTDADGHYELRLPPEQNWVYWMGSPSEAWHAERKDLWVELEEGADQTVDFRLFRKPTITLTVLNPDGTPAAGVEVSWRGGEYGLPVSERDPLTTDARGQVELTFGRRHGLDEKPVATALVQDRERDLAGLVFVNAETDRQATITLQQAAWVAASVEDHEGKPLPDIELQAFVRPASLDGRWAPMPDPMRSLGAKSDADGQVSLGPLPPGVPLTVGGAEEIATKAVSSPDEANVPVVLEPGETLIIEPYVLMLEGYSLRGTVVDGEGEPVEGTLVLAGQTPDLQTKTDAEGRFELKGLSVRRRGAVIAALPDGSAAYAEPIDPSVAFEPTIQLAPPVTIVATVLDDDGKPVVGASARIHSDGPLHLGLPGELKTYAQELRTDERGQFRAEGLIAGLEYSVMAYTGEHMAPEDMWGDRILVLGGEGVIEMTLTRRRR